jgi:hypothetical protein
MFSRARVLVDFQMGVAPTGTEVPLVDGTVRTDASADIRSSLSATVAGAGLWPNAADDLLAPYGNEIFVERGVDYGNGVVEVVSLGYHRIDTSTQSTGPNGEIRLTATDRMANIVDSRLLAPRQFRANQSVGEVFDALVGEVYPEAEIIYDFNEDTTLLGTDQVAEEDRYGFLNSIAVAHGKIMYWDHTGRLRVVSPPDPTVPVFQINSGAYGNLVQLGRSLTRRGVYNAVVAVGESPGDLPPAQRTVYDNNPLSPTYWNGRFGHVPRFYYSPFITNEVQAQSAAESILQQAIGLPYSVDFTIVPNPALEPYDSIQITAPDRVDVHVLDSLTIPLTSSVAMTGTTRQLITFDPIVT